MSGLFQLSDDEVYREPIDARRRIHFYGDYEKVLAAPYFRSILGASATLTDATASGDGPLLLIRLFADDPYPTIARPSVELAERQGRPPDRTALIEACYGRRWPT